MEAGLTDEDITLESVMAYEGLVIQAWLTDESITLE